VSPDTLDVRDVPQRDRFEARLGDEVVGIIDYRRARDGAVALTHAEVVPRYGGRGIGTVMVRAALDDLAGRDERILPLCSFVRAFVHDNPAYRRLVA
jgi:hypothetical protein